MDPLLLRTMQICRYRKGGEKAAARNFGATSCQAQDGSGQNKMTQVPSPDSVSWRDPEAAGT